MKQEGPEAQSTLARKSADADAGPAAVNPSTGANTLDA